MNLAACQRLMAKLAAHIAELETQAAPRDATVPVSPSLPASHSVSLAVQVSREASTSQSNREAMFFTDTPRIAVSPGASTTEQTLEAMSLSSRLEDLIARVRDRDALIEEQARVILELQDARVTLQRENETLQLTLTKLLHMIYGRRSERFLEDPTQKKLPFPDVHQAEDTFQEAVEEAEKVIREIEVRRKTKTPPQGRSEKFPEHLRREEKAVEVDDRQKTCVTHGERKLIGYDTIETLKITRPELYVEVTKFPKYACLGHPDCGVFQPERPQGLVAGNRYDTSIAIEVINQRYGFHMPYYRQQDWFGACGWTPTRSTLLNIVTAAEAIFKPLADYYRQLLLQNQVIGCDDTTVTLVVPPVIPSINAADPRSKRIHEVFSAAKAKNHPSVTARMWAYRGIDVELNVFDFTVSRHRDGPDEVLAKYNGILMGDCWSGFQQIGLRSDLRITRAACWAHARRKIFDGRSSHPQQAAVLLALVRQLYDIEDRGKPLSVADRLSLRQSESIPLLNRIRAYVDSLDDQLVLPKSAFAEALGYLRNHWTALLVYATNGLTPIDNNEVEQLMKRVAIGRKNWLFIGSVDAGNRTATLLTLVSSAIRHNLDVGAYLKDVLDQLLAGSTDYHSMRADVWKQSHPEHIRVYRQEERQEASDRRSYRRAARRIAESQKTKATATTAPAGKSEPDAKAPEGSANRSDSQKSDK